MNSTLFAVGNAVTAHTGIDFSDKEGFLLKENAGALAINDSATVPARCVCLEGADETENSSVMPLGCVPAPIRLKAGGVISKFNRIAQKNDGTVIADPDAGARVIVGTALEDAVAGALFLAIVHAPQTFAA
jgi:hypothetical protein